MKRFIQLHILTSYPPANLNRDDLGRPKTAKMGGVDRLRVSSQSLKRHWRTSELFQSALDGHLGRRTKLLGTEVHGKLTESGVDGKKALEWARTIAGVFGKNKVNKQKPEQELEIEQLVHIGPSEQALIDQLVATLIAEQRAPEKEELDLLRKDNQAADIALFGRMLASNTAFNTEAACQVAHALSVHSVVLEDDYFTAVDDLNSLHDDNAGSAHIGETQFAAGLFYSYICINRDLLIANLNGDENLAKKAVVALTEAALKVAPSGKQNSFGSRAYASYALAEMGDQQPRSLSVAYLKPVHNRCEDFGVEAIDALKKQQENFDKVYGACADVRCEMNVLAGAGSLEELLAFVGE